MKSSAIRWEPVETVTHLKIPYKYHVHFYINSIIGIDEHKMPVYGKKHTAEIELPPQYPLEPCRIKMITDLWHPNIKWKGSFKGRICAQAEKFGTIYELPQLILRIGEILQYKNYHAEHVAPFPEDAEVAKWVTEFAEPNNIVNKSKDISVDNTPLIDDENKSTDILKITAQRPAPVSAERSKLAIQFRDATPKED
ncbi:MAG: hypothetical protein IT260_08900 [Saprospiraceae bacterium]|nr:hypothetical protein [Saprospiraceae bacterium]